MSKLRWEQMKILSEAMLKISHKNIATSKEVTIAVREVAIEKWDYLAKQNLKKIDLITDKDVHEALSTLWPDRMIEDPDPTITDYDNVAIID